MAVKGKHWQKCAVKGCRRYAITNELRCQKHDDEDRLRKAAKPKPPEVLTALCAAVAAKYRAEGDAVQAGVVVACLSHNPPRFYASVARYPHNPMVKKIVCKVGHGDPTPILTAEAAVNALALKWAETNRPAPVRETMARLENALDYDLYDLYEIKIDERDRG